MIINDKKKQLISIIIMIVAGIIIGIFSYNTVWLADDINYQQNLALRGDNPEKLKELVPKVKNLADIIESQNSHYFTTNGRYVAHVLVQGFCGIWGHLPFAICNGIVYIMFFLTILKLCGIKLENITGVLSIVILALLTFQTRMMPAYQIGFVWMFTLTLALLILFFQNNRIYPIWFSIIAGLIAILIGNGQEALNLGIAASMVIYWFNNIKKMTTLQYTLMIGFCIGFLINGLSPGTLNRGSRTVEPSVSFIFFNFPFFLYSLRALWFLSAVVLYQKIRHKLSWITIYSDNKFYWNAMLFLLLFNVIIHFQSNRSGFGIELMALIIGMKLLPKKSMNYFWLTIFTIWLTINYIFQADIIWRKKNFINKLKYEYSKSDDGRVYLDMDFSSPLIQDRDFSGIILPLGVNNGGEGNFDYNNIAKQLRADYPGKKWVRILPSYLKNKEHVDIGNKLLYCGNGIWLAIQSKSNPAEFMVKRDIPFLASSKPATVDMTVPECIIAEGDNWRARFIAKDNYLFHGFNFVSGVEIVKQ